MKQKKSNQLRDEDDNQRLRLFVSSLIDCCSKGEGGTQKSSCVTQIIKKLFGDR